MSDLASRLLYRHLFRLCRQFDTRPELRCFLFRRPSSVYNRLSEKWMDQPQQYKNIADKYVANFLSSTPNSSENIHFYNPQLAGAQSACDALRAGFRETGGGAALDTGFILLRILTETETVARELMLSSQDEVLEVDKLAEKNGFPAELVFEHCDSVSQGSVLLAHPLLLQDGLMRAAILLTMADPGDGCIGLVLNHPLPVKVGELVASGDGDVKDDRFKVFHDNILWLGGDVQKGESLQCLHRHGNLVKGSIQVVLTWVLLFL